MAAYNFFLGISSKMAAGACEILNNLIHVVQLYIQNFNFPSSNHSNPKLLIESPVS